MNELQFIQYRYQLRIREKQSAKDIWLSSYCCFLYMLLKAFNITGKMMMVQIYNYIYSSNQSENCSFANIQWFCFEIAAPFGLQWIPIFLLKNQFRVILFVSAFGSILFIVPLQYATLCKDSIDDVCNIYVMWTFTIIFSFISGFCKTVLLFSMLYYLSNLAGGKERVIYYSSFYFIHQFQWLIGSLLGNLLFLFSGKKSLIDTLNHIYIILIISSIFICLLFLTLPEESKKSKFSKFKKAINYVLIQKDIKNIKKSRKIEKQQLLELRQQSNLIDPLLDFDEIDDEKDKIYKALSKPDQIQHAKPFFTIQCFSFEEEELEEILTQQPKSSDDLYWFSNTQKSISVDEYASNNYFGNLYLTLSNLCLDGFIHFIVLIFNVGSLMAFILMQLPYILVISQNLNAQVFASQIYEGFLYVGVGQIFGCFYMGLFGDLAQKIIGFYYILAVNQVGCLLSWGIYLFKIDFMVFFISFIFGFCCSAMLSATISFQVVYFQRFIYSVDLMYIIFSLSFSFTSLLYIITNFSDRKFDGLILQQVIGILGIFSTWRIQVKIKNKQNKQG